MSVINKVLRDLEQRGAPAPEFAGAIPSSAPLPRAARRRSAVSLRTAVWGSAAAVVCATLGAYGWQVERMKASALVAKPLGAAQFAAALPKDSAAVTTAAAPLQAAPSALETNATKAAIDPPTKETVSAAAPAQEPAQKPAAEAAATITKPAPPKAMVAPERSGANPISAAPAAKSREHEPKHVAPAATAVAAGVAPIVTRRINPEEAQLERAAEFITRGRSQEAITLLTQLLSSAPNHQAARQALAALQAESGRRDLALQTLLAGAALEPARFAVAAARLQAEAGDATGALVTLDRFPTARRDADYDALVGGLAQRTGQHAIAAEAFARAVRTPRAPAIWWAGLGHSLDSLGQRAQAQTAFTRALSDPALPPALRSFIAQRLAELAAARPPMTPAIGENAPLAALPQ